MKSAPLITTPALVLKRFDFGETSQTARLFTRDRGRLSVLAKGIKRGGAELRGPMDLLARAEVAVRLRRGTDLHLLVRYRVATGFPGLRRNLERLWAAFYVAEVLLEGTRDEDPAPALFDVAVATLETLEASSSAEVAPITAWFELHYLDLAGFRPRFEACVRCGRVAPPRGPVRYSIHRGGLVCRRCAAERPHALVPIRAPLRAALGVLLDAPGPETARALKLAQEDRRALRALLPPILEAVMEKELRSAAFVRP